MSTTYLLTFDGASVHCKVAKIGEELLGAILALDELEEIWSVVDELSILSIFSIPLIFYCQNKFLTVVQVFPEMKTSCVRSRNRKGIFVYIARSVRFMIKKVTVFESSLP